MTVCPGGMLSGRGARRIEEALLRQHHKRPLGMFPLPDLCLCTGNLGQGTPDMYRPGARAFGSLPRDRPVKCVIDLEHAWSIAVTLELVLVSGRKTRTRDMQELARGNIAEDGLCGREYIKRLDLCIGDDLTAHCAQIGGHGIDDMLGAPTGYGPANRVAEDAQYQPIASAWRLLKTQHRVRAHSREDSAGAFAFK